MRRVPPSRAAPLSTFLACRLSLASRHDEPTSTDRHGPQDEERSEREQWYPTGGATVRGRQQCHVLRPGRRTYDLITLAGRRAFRGTNPGSGERRQSA